MNDNEYICDGCAQGISECFCDIDLAEVLDCNSPFHPGCRNCEVPMNKHHSGNWISGAIKHPGALHRQLNVPAGSKIPAATLAKAASAGGKLGQRARLAQTLKGFGR